MSDKLQTLFELEQLLTRFVAGAGEDISLAAANKIEGCIVGSLPEDDELQELADLLAHYRPEGGDYLFQYQDIRPQAEIALEEVRRRIR